MRQDSSFPIEHNKPTNNKQTYCQRKDCIDDDGSKPKISARGMMTDTMLKLAMIVMISDRNMMKEERKKTKRNPLNDNNSRGGEKKCVQS